MIKVAICDDDKQICSKLIAIVKEYFADIGRPVWVAEFTSGLKLLKANIRFDVIFLDIDMPVVNDRAPPTAASACFPTKRPTTIVSAVL